MYTYMYLYKWLFACLACICWRGGYHQMLLKLLDEAGPFPAKTAFTKMNNIYTQNNKTM